MSATLNIASGLHRGAMIELLDERANEAAREYVLGSGDECDIVLRDASLAPRHCVLKQEWSGLTLRDLRDDQSPVIKPQTTHYRGFDTEVAYDIGGVTITLLHRPAADSAPRHRPRWVDGCFLAAGLAVAIAAFAAKQEATPPSAAAAAKNAAHRPAPDATLLEQVRNTFSADDLRISLNAGTLRIAGETGHLDVKQRIQSLAEDLRGVVAVEDSVTYRDAREHSASAGPFPVKLRGVKIGDPSYFLTDRGARYFVGGVLPDGAEVLAIESDRIRLHVGGRDVIYNLE